MWRVLSFQLEKFYECDIPRDLPISRSSLLSYYIIVLLFSRTPRTVSAQYEVPGINNGNGTGRYQVQVLVLVPGYEYYRATEGGTYLDNVLHVGLMNVDCDIATSTRSSHGRKVLLFLQFFSCQRPEKLTI